MQGIHVRVVMVVPKERIGVCRDRYIFYLHLSMRIK